MILTGAILLLAAAGRCAAHRRGKTAKHTEAIVRLGCATRSGGLAGSTHHSGLQRGADARRTTEEKPECTDVHEDFSEVVQQSRCPSIQTARSGRRA